MAAGMKATTTLSANRCATGSVRMPAKVLMSRARYSHTTAIIAPVWMAISNTLMVSPVKSSSDPVRMR